MRAVTSATHAIPGGCALAGLLRALLQTEYECSNLLGLYPDGIWLQGKSRPLKIPLPAWASMLIGGLDQGRHPGDPITDTDILDQLRRQGLLVLSHGELWAQGALATALLQQEGGDPEQERPYQQEI